MAVGLIMISFSSPHWKYFFVALSGSTFYCDTPLQSFLIAILSDSILSVIRRCSSFDCDFLDVILLWHSLAIFLIVVLPGSTFDFGTPLQYF